MTDFAQQLREIAHDSLIGVTFDEEDNKALCQAADALELAQTQIARYLNEASYQDACEVLNVLAERDALRAALEAAPPRDLDLEGVSVFDYIDWYEGPRAEALK